MKFFSRKSPEEKAAKEREDIIERLQDTLRKGDIMQVYSIARQLTEEKHLAGPETPFVINGTIENIAQRSTDEGIRFALYMISNIGNRKNGEVFGLLADKAFDLITRADKTDMKQMAGVAMLTHVLSDAYVDDPAQSARARKEWQSAFDTLTADKKEGIQYAFAAASNVAIAKSWKNPLRQKAIEAWSEAVADLAKTDKPAALKEAARVAGGYDSFGDDAVPFRSIAQGALQKLSR